MREIIDDPGEPIGVAVFPGRVEGAVRAMLWAAGGEEIQAGTIPRIDDKLFTTNAIGGLLGRLVPAPEEIKDEKGARAFIAHICTGLGIYLWKPKLFFERHNDNGRGHGLTEEQMEELNLLTQQMMACTPLYRVMELHNELICELFLA